MIDEKILVEEFEERMKDDNYMCPIIKVIDVIEIIDKQPKVNEWIPCSEKLPMRQDSENILLQMYLVQTKRESILMGFRDEDGSWRTNHGNLIPNVVAWMPLPEPYKPEV